MADQTQPQTDILTALRNLRRDRAAGTAAPIAAAQTAIAGPPAGSLADLQRTAVAFQGLAAPEPGASGARSSNVQETVQRAAAAEQLKGVASAAQAADAQAAQRETALANQAQRAATEAGLDSLSIAERATQQRARILESARQATEEGRMARAKAAVDQSEFLRRLENEKYVSQLQRDGAERRLGTEIGFKEALAQDVFGEQLELFKGRLSWEELMAADDRAFQEKMANIGFDEALAMAEAQAEGAKIQGMVGGFTGLASGAAKGYETANRPEQGGAKTSEPGVP
jgi:pyruvate/2-oxoglutarate dehydrogenase complex dihydrolipoamide acyltransferase (E2) component